MSLWSPLGRILKAAAVAVAIAFAPSVALAHDGHAHRAPATQMQMTNTADHQQAAAEHAGDKAVAQQLTAASPVSSFHALDCLIGCDRDCGCNGHCPSSGAALPPGLSAWLPASAGTALPVRDAPSVLGLDAEALRKPPKTFT